MKINDLIIEFIDKKRTPRIRKGSKRYSPSSFGKCFRRQFWQRKEEPTTNEVFESVAESAELGNLCEYLYMQNNQGGGQILLETEHVKGYCDLELDSVVKEIKSVSGDAWSKINKYSDRDLQENKLSNGLQCKFYSMQLNKPGVLVYISRDSLKLKEFKIINSDIIINFDKDVIKICEKELSSDWDELLKYELGLLIKFWESGEIPPPRPRFLGECNMCCYLDKCEKYTGGENGRENVNNRGEWVW